MTWSEGVHARHVQALYRPLRPEGRFEPAKEPDNSDLGPVVALSGVLAGLCAYQAHRQHLQPAKLRRVPVIGPWLVRAARRLSAHREQPGDARHRAGQAAARRAQLQSAPQQEQQHHQPQQQPQMPAGTKHKKKHSNRKKRK